MHGFGREVLISFHHGGVITFFIDLLKARFFAMHPYYITIL